MKDSTLGQRLWDEERAYHRKTQEVTGYILG